MAAQSSSCRTRFRHTVKADVANFGTRRLAVGLVFAATLTAAALTPSAALPSSSVQVVTAVPEQQFGIVMSADGSISSSASTIPVTVRRTVEHGVTVITIVPTLE
jgi:hypothetical protein